MVSVKKIVSTANTANTIARVVRAGTVGGAARILTEKAVNPYANRIAQRAADRFNKNKRLPLPQERLTGPIFWFMALVALAKDFLDIIVNMTIALAPLVIILGLVFGFVITFYLYLSGVDFDTKRIVTVVISTIISMVPFLSIIPATVLGLLIVRWFEHSEHVKKMILHHYQSA